VNSEELEQSLRAEFDSHIKTVVAEMKQEVSDFKGNIESELEKHKAHLDEMFREFSEKFGQEKDLDASFTESVTEHLKLARDEGAKITAAAIAEAEEMREAEEPEVQAADDFSDMRDAINEISSKDSQAEILKSLVHHAGQYTPRGAFFIVKNEHLVGWRVFGTEDHPNPDVVREVYFPISSNTSLSESVNSLGTVSTGFGSHEDDSKYLDTLGFGQPENMYAIPLIARGRGVAALYADKGDNGREVNVEALETLVRIAGLTVEVLAAAPAPAKPKVEEASAPEVQEQQPEESYETQQGFVAPVPTEEWAAEEEQASVEEAPAPQQFDAEPVTEEYEVQPAEETQPAFEENTWSQPEQEVQEEVSEFSPEPVSEYETTSDYSAPEAETQDFSTAYEPAVEEDAAPAVDEFQPDSAFEYKEEEAPAQFEAAPQEEASEFEFQQEPAPVEEAPQAETSEFSFEETPSQFEETPQAETPDFSFEQEPSQKEEVSQFDASEQVESPEFEAAPEPNQFEIPSVPTPAVDDFSSINETPAESFDFEGDLSESSLTGQSVETQSGVEAPVVEAPVEEAAPAPPVRSRFGDRNVDLPIEVAEDERRYHNDARRFARLLVSEIKLYNEQKVKEGRDSADLYERLREAIDRSREMYDKRVQPPVAAKFDYFNYELVNTLAEGDEGKLGGSYPGANA